MVDYQSGSRVARVAVRHPVVARWLAGDTRRGATLLAMAVYGAINRERADVTAAEECAAMDAALAAMASTSTCGTPTTPAASDRSATAPPRRADCW